MKHNTLKLGLMSVLLSAFLAGCTTPDSNDSSQGSGADIDNQAPADVDVGGVDQGGSIGDGDSDALAGVDTIFYFDFDKAVLKPEAREALLVHAEALRNNPRNIRLEGHADERGTREYNLALAERRANTVRDFLLLQGVNGSYVEVISYGEEKPAVFGSDADSMALNRRVELK